MNIAITMVTNIDLRSCRSNKKIWHNGGVGGACVRMAVAYIYIPFPPHAHTKDTTVEVF